MNFITRSFASKLLNISPIPAAILNVDSNAIWYNDAYINRFKDIKLDAFISNHFNINTDDINSFIYNDINQFLPTDINTNISDFYILKQHIESVKFSFFTFLTKEEYNKYYDLQNNIESFFFMNLHQPAIIFDFNTGIIQSANNEFLSIYGLSLPHMIGLHIQDIFNESKQLIQTYLEKDEPYTKEFLINQYDLHLNKTITYEIVPLKMKTSNGYKVIFQLNNVFSEIKEQKDDISNNFLKSYYIQKSVTDGMLIIENDIVKEVNNAACEMWGYTKEEFIDSNINNFIPDSALYIGNSSLINGNSISLSGLKKDGSLFNVMINVQTFENDGINYVMYITKDTTVDLAIDKLLYINPNVKKTIIDPGLNLIIIFSEDYKLLNCNNLMIDFLGYSSIDDTLSNIHDLGSFSSLFLKINKENFITGPYKAWLSDIIENPNKLHKVAMYDKNDNINIFKIEASMMKNEIEKFYFITLSNITKTIEYKESLNQISNIINVYTNNNDNEQSSNILLYKHYQNYTTLGTIVDFISNKWITPIEEMENALKRVTHNVKIRDEISASDFLSLSDTLENNIDKIKNIINNFYHSFTPNIRKKNFNLLNCLKDSILIISPLFTEINAKIDHKWDNKIPDEINYIEFHGIDIDMKQVFLNIFMKARDNIEAKRNKNPNYEGLIFIKIENPKVNKIVIKISDNGELIKKSFDGDILNNEIYISALSKTDLNIYLSKIILKKMNGVLSIKSDNKHGNIYKIELPVTSSK